MNKYLTAGVALALVVSVYAALNPSTEKVVERIKEVGVAAGPEKQEHQYFNNGFTAGKRVSTTTSVATYTTERSDFSNLQTYWDVTPNVNTTISISATSTHKYVPDVGDVATVYVRNASSTAAATITWAAENANVDIQHADGGNLVLNGLDYGTLTFIREDTYTTSVIFDEFTEGD